MPGAGDFAYGIAAYNPAGQIVKRTVANDKLVWANPASATDSFTAPFETPPCGVDWAPQSTLRMKRAQPVHGGGRGLAEL